MPVTGDGTWLVYSIVTILFPAVLAFFASWGSNGSWFGPRRPKWNYAGQRAGQRPLNKV